MSAHRHTFKLAAILSSLFICLNCHSQNAHGLSDSLANISALNSLEQKLVGFNWHGTDNALALKQMNMQHFAVAGFNLAQTSGRYKRPQEAGRLCQIGFGAAGLNTFKGWNFYGDFSYDRIEKKAVNFSNVSSPYEGNPFITADSIGGDWKGDQLRANLHIAYPALGKWRLGNRINYLVEQSSRRNDPRPLYRYLNTEFNQMLGYQLNAKSLLSLQFGYRRKTEEVETGQYTSISYKLYSLRGYGTYDYVPVVSALRYTNGSGWNVGAGYLYEDQKAAFHLQTEIAYTTEDVKDEPILIGGYDELLYCLKMGYQRKYSKLRGWSTTLSAKITDGTGYDPRFSGTNPSLYFMQVNSEIAYWRPISNKSWIRISYLPAWESRNYNETMAQTDWLVNKLHQDLSLNWIYRSSTRLQLEANPTIGYHFPLDGQLVTGRPTAITNLLVVPDYAYANQKYLKTGLRLSATLSTEKLTYRLQTSYNQFSSNELGKRGWAKCTLQLLF